MSKPTGEDILSMSDEDFLKNPPSIPEESTSQEEQNEASTNSNEGDGNSASTQTESNESGTPPENQEGQTQEQQEEEQTSDKSNETTEPVLENQEPVKVTTEGKPEDNSSKVEPESNSGKPKSDTPVPGKEQTSTDYEGFYKHVTKPFKANGKTLEIKTPEEAIQLMQLGANYTQKMQQIAPMRKIMGMLQKANLTDENQLNFLIDLHQKNPDAIRKLVQDAKIDPLQMDVETPSDYKAGDHRVSDSEANFTSVVEDLDSSPEGKAVLNDLNQWDDETKAFIWNNPASLNTLRQHKESGDYDRITSEIERRKTLGVIPLTTPFIQAYTAVGTELSNKGSQNTPQSTPAAPVAQRVVSPKPKVVNSDRASAASAPRSGNSVKTPPKNFLSMSDEEFLALNKLSV